ncbi:MAG: metal ABC transporter solute-binding protein, Zn/Mn family [Anaerolineae bacterium]
MCRMLMCLLALGLAAACSGPSQTESTGASQGQDVVRVTVSIAPQQYFVERIGGDRVHVTVMVPTGSDPHTYEPSPGHMRDLSEADLYLAIGEGFEQAWMDRFRSVNPDMQVVDTSAGIERIPVTQAGQEATDGHDESTLDPHIWVSPRLVKVQAQTTRDALVALDPAHTSDYDANLSAFLADLDALDAEIVSALEGKERRQFVVFHPSWGYFARDYGLEQIPVEVDGQEPSAAELASLIALAREEDIRVILAQPEFSTQAAETIAQEIGGEVLLISPLAPDWLDNMRRVMDTFARALE